MAEKGKELDLTRPLRMVNGIKIEKIEKKDCFDLNFSYLVKAYFYKKDGALDYSYYNPEGFFRGKENNPFFAEHLIYDDNTQEKTMRLEIYEDRKDKEETVIRLKLCRDHFGVSVEAVDDKGNRIPQGTLVRFDATGTLSLMHTVNSELGFELDHLGRIIK
jgi:hypothetical protein